MTTTATSTCRQCALEFEGKPGRIFCSVRCSTRRNGRPRKGRTCEICDTTYDATWSGQRTCSRACGLQLGTRRGPLPKPRPIKPPPPVHQGDCPQCGSRFTYTGQGRRTYCGRVCKRAAALERRRATRDWGNRRRCTPLPTPCTDCSTAIVQPPRRKCDTCLRVTRKARKQRDRRRRRALKHGAISEPYTLTYIAKRDRLRCGLCHAKVNVRLVVPHPKAPTVDHIVPLASGGDDTKANVQLAHFQCNVTKREHGGGEQLLLFG